MSDEDLIKIVQEATTHTNMYGEKTPYMIRSLARMVLRLNSRVDVLEAMIKELATARGDGL
jgi:hypothetical protein